MQRTRALVSAFVSRGDIRKYTTSSLTGDVIPKLYYLHSGPGSVLSAGIPKGATFIVSNSVCNVLGMSPNISKKWTYFSNTSEAFYRRTTGAPFFFDQYSTSGSVGDLILSSKESDDVAITDIDYGVDLLIASGSSLLCAGGDIGLTTFWKTPTMKPSLRISGHGSLAFRSPGRIVKMFIEPGEAYYINLKYLLAYESTIVFHGKEEDLNFSKYSPKTNMSLKTDDDQTKIQITQEAAQVTSLDDNIKMSLKERIQSYFNTFTKVTVQRDCPTGATIYLHGATSNNPVKNLLPTSTDPKIPEYIPPRLEILENQNRPNPGPRPQTELQQLKQE